MVLCTRCVRYCPLSCGSWPETRPHHQGLYEVPGGSFLPRVSWLSLLSVPPPGPRLRQLKSSSEIPGEVAPELRLGDFSAGPGRKRRALQGMYVTVWASLGVALRRQQRAGTGASGHTSAVGDSVVVGDRVTAENMGGGWIGEVELPGSCSYQGEAEVSLRVSPGRTGNSRGAACEGARPGEAEAGGGWRGGRRRGSGRSEPPAGPGAGLLGTTYMLERKERMCFLCLLKMIPNEGPRLLAGASLTPLCQKMIFHRC